MTALCRSLAEFEDQGAAESRDIPLVTADQPIEMPESGEGGPVGH